MEIREVELNETILDQLIRFSEDWTAEGSCYGYRPNTPSDIEGNRIFVAEEEGNIVGYLFGIANKVVNDDINYVLAFYILDLCLVLIDTAIYYMNTLCQHDDSATADD